MLHADYFRYRTVEKTRVSEEVGEGEGKGEVDGSVLLVLVCAEKSDERDLTTIVDKSVEAVVDIAGRVKPNHIVLHSFAHLSEDLASPDAAKSILDDMQSKMTARGYKCAKTPFGWRDSFELGVKSHPISKVFRPIGLT